MSIRHLAILATCSAAIAACQPEQAGEPSAPPSEAPEASAPPGAATPPPQPAGTNPGKADPFAGENDGYPDLTPAPLTPEAARTVKGARAILLPWARAIELREFDQAWNMMGTAAKDELSRTQFNALFHPLRDLTVAIPEGTLEGAAGSSYYTVPTTVSAIGPGGTKATLAGEVVMRRVNDVPGATPEQLAWHIERVSLAAR